MLIAYIGTKKVKSDNVAGTGLVWSPGEKHEISDPKKIEALLKHPDIWVDASKPYKVRTATPVPNPAIPPLPRAQFQPIGGVNANPFWDPIVFPVPEHIFRGLQEHTIEPVFMSIEDLKMFHTYLKREGRKNNTPGKTLTQIEEEEREFQAELEAEEKKKAEAA